MKSVVVSWLRVSCCEASACSEVAVASERGDLLSPELVELTLTSLHQLLVNLLTSHWLINAELWLVQHQSRAAVLSSDWSINLSRRRASSWISATTRLFQKYFLPHSELEIIPTSNLDNPVTQCHTPVQCWWWKLHLIVAMNYHHFCFIPTQHKLFESWHVIDPRKNNYLCFYKPRFFGAF